VASRLVHRPARTVRPVSAAPPEPIAPPPVLPDGRSGPNVVSLLPLAGAGGAMAMMMFIRGSVFAALGAVILVVALGAAAAFYLTQRGQGARRRRAQRELYLDHLEELRERLRDEEEALRRRLLRPDPPLSHLLDVVTDPARRWERRRADPDFLRVRLGTGALTVRELPMRDEGTPVAPTDPFMRSEAQAVIRRFGRVAGVPLRVALDRAGDVSVIGGDRAAVLGLVRAILAQVAALHAPDDVTVAVLAPPAAESDWAWARWLPHALDRGRPGPEGPVPLLAPDPPTLAALLADDLAARAAAGGTDTRLRPRLIVVDDAFGGTARCLPVADPRALGVTVVHLLADRLHEPGEVSSRVTVAGGQVLVEHVTGPLPGAIDGERDDAPAAFVEGLARRLAPLRLSPDSLDDGTGTPPADVAALLGIDAAQPGAVEVRRLWRPRPERDVLRVPLGVDGAGRPVLLDLKEAAALGMGPHGLCVGATGSGKSELLRTIVLGLAATHPPETLALVLVDYKGGATFAPFRTLPHVAGLITNLAADAALVDRMYTSLDGEVLRRQQLLADAGGATDLAEYALRRVSRPELPPLPHLQVILDEFGELLVAKPEFVELLLRIGRIGRSIGMHLLLAGQRIEPGKMRGLETHLSYRIGLRTLSESESRAVLDTADAFALPPLPGHAYLKVDTTVYQRFRAGYVSGALAEPATEPVPDGPRVRELPRFGAPPAVERGPAGRPVRRTTGPTLLSAVVDRLAAAGTPVAPVWLPPLPAALTLDAAGGGVAAGPDGVRLRSAPDVVIGLLDDPARQWQGPWVFDLDAGSGHHLVIGGPGSGATTALRTIALALATGRPPTDVAIYGVDLGGAGLRDLAGLPHVGGVAGRDDPERVRRTVDEVVATVDRREKLFAEQGFDTVADLRAAGAPADLGGTDVVLLLDGYAALAGQFESIAPAVHDVLARGGRYGVHVLAAARR
jgi:S-DNA-T family DNA segregation ATPase FtsK/SpoIIIE